MWTSFDTPLRSEENETTGVEENCAQAHGRKYVYYPRGSGEVRTALDLFMERFDGDPDMDEETTLLQLLSAPSSTLALVLQKISMRERNRKRSAPGRGADMSVRPEQIPQRFLELHKRTENV